MTHRTDIQIRFNDTDALGHLNNSSYALYAEYARIRFLEDLGVEVKSLILAHLSLDFRKQVAYGEEVAVETWVERVGSSSVTLAQHVLAEGEVTTEMRSVVVQFDYDTQRARALTDELRKRLSDYLRD